MSKTFQFTFAINGLVSQGFSGSMNTARNGLISLQKQSRDLKTQMKELDAALYKNEIDFEGYAQKTAKVKNQLKQLELQQERLNRVMAAKSNLKNAASQFAGLALGVYAAAQPVIGMINTAAEFEQGMSKVGAITRASAEDMALLTAKAKELGRQTQFTARQSADAMSYLGMAGWNTQEILKGMPGLLNLAAAGGTDLARTADIVSDDLTAFGLTAQDAGHMADVFAYTITRTNTNVEMLGETMKYAAPVAHAFGASMEETAALAGLMANSGIKASQAGTALRSGLLRLAGPPKQAAKAMEALGMDMSEMSKQQAEAQAAMKALGIQLSDTSGPRKMSAIITELRDKMQGLGKEERLAAMGAIFGKNASTGWLAVIDSAPEKFDQLVNEMDKCDGEAERMAKTMNNNAKGAMTRLKSAMESAAISFGGVFLPVLADVGDGLAKFAGLVGDAAEKHPVLVQTLGLVTVAMTGAALAMKAAGVIYAAYTVATAAATTGTWAFNAALLANPIGLVVVAVVGLIAAGYALYKNWDKVSAGLVAGWEWVKTTAWNFLTSLPEKAGYAVGYIIGWFKTLPERIIGIFKSMDSVGQTFINSAIEWGKSAVNGLIDGFLSLPGRLTGIVSRAWESAKAAFSKGEAAGSAGVAQNAAGGIYGKGAFLTTFAEDSGESAIPHKRTKRNIGLLEKTNQIMGNPLQPKVNVYPQINQTQPNVSVYPQVNPVQPNVNVNPQFNAEQPNVGVYPQFSQAQPNVTVSPLFNQEKPNVNVYPQVNIAQPNVNVSPLFNPVINGNKQELPVINVPRPEVVTAQKETLIERIKEMGSPANIIERVKEIGRPASEAPNIVYQPQITITGNADKEVVQKALDMSMEKFRQMFRQLQQEERRVSYA